MSGLRKAYDDAEAVRGIAFTIAAGEVFGLLGPNGAGKTTTVEILEGYRQRDAGDVAVLGVDPARAPDAWRGRLGDRAAERRPLPEPDRDRAPAALRRLLRAAARGRRRRDAMVGLEEKRGARYRTLSGGQRRRLDLGVALVGDPDLIFLDEPTTGFDPAARRAAWDTIRSLRDLGKTILLTTHYIEEAHRLADHVAVLSQGEIVASGTPAELIGAGSGTEIHYRRNGSEVVVRTEDPTRTLHELTGEALAAGETLEGLEVRRPTLEEIYLSLTGEGLE